MPPQIKYPPFIDISHWIEVPDFAKLDPRPWMIGTKATQGTSYLDPAYGAYSLDAREIGSRLLSYHFMEPSDPIKQANWFCEILREGELRKNEALACDVEVEGISLDMIKAFLDRTQSLVGIRPIIYSTELLLESLYPNSNPPVWAMKEWYWIAEYPFNPDQYSEIPQWIVPYGISKDRIAAWQYTDDGIYPGIPGNNVDLNLLSPLYIQSIGLTEPSSTPGEPPMSDTVLYYSDLAAGNTSNVRSAGDLSAPVLQVLTGPVTVSITGEAVVNDGYSWYPISAPTHGFIAKTASYGPLRPANDVPVDSDPPVKVTIETASGKIYVCTDLKQV